MEGRLYNLPHRHPENNSVSASAPSAHSRAYAGSEGVWPGDNPHGDGLCLGGLGSAQALTPPVGFGERFVSIPGTAALSN